MTLVTLPISVHPRVTYKRGSNTSADSYSIHDVILNRLASQKVFGLSSARIIGGFAGSIPVWKY